MIRSQKETQIKEIKEKFSSSNATIVTNYKGLTVEKISSLRKELRKINAEYKVYKNTMSEIAYKSFGFDNIGNYFSGSTAIAFSKGDPAKLAKILNDFKKENELFGIKCGTLGNNLINEQEVKALASLPPREVLLAKLLGNMKGPIAGFVNLLSGNIRNLAYVLKSIAEQKEKAAA